MNERDTNVLNLVVYQTSGCSWIHLTLIGKCAVILENE